MMKASELKAWAATLDDDQIVGIDDGGLTIEVVGSEAYIELGGMPRDDEDDNPFHPESPASEFAERLRALVSEFHDRGLDPDSMGNELNIQRMIRYLRPKRRNGGNQSTLKKPMLLREP